MAVRAKVTWKCLKYRWTNANDLKSCNLRNFLPKNSNKFVHFGQVRSIRSEKLVIGFGHLSRMSGTILHLYEPQGRESLKPGLSILGGAHPPFSPAFGKMGRLTWDTQEENEEALSPTVQIKEVIACIAPWTGRGTQGKKKHMNWKTAEDESQRKSVILIFFFHLACAYPTGSLWGCTLDVKWRSTVLASNQ